jgi:hypothetical protein
MKQSFLQIQLSEVFFLIAGIGMLVSLPWLESGGFFAWILPKAAYVLGVIFLIFKK